ncbi:MAG: divalent-cation tolerance protein CutA [Nitrospirales bacterium]|nr:MAG: divalent-cation tolerance protein CutA [Nitrospirales bacterium]
MEEIVVMVTVGSEGEAISLSKILVKNGLAACVNVIPGVQSIFKWDGQITEEREYLLLVKTVRQAFDQLVLMVKANHSYEIPEIISFPIQLGSKEYLAWIRDSTKIESA